MTENNIEEQFFKTFGIEPKWKDTRSKKTCIYTEEQAKEIRKTNRNIQLCYPPITADVLLRLICILNDYYSKTMQCCTMLNSKNIYALKDEILKEFIDILGQYSNLTDKDRDDIEEEDWIINQVRSLFEEVNQ